MLQSRSNRSSSFTLIVNPQIRASSCDRDIELLQLKQEKLILQGVEVYSWTGVGINHSPTLEGRIGEEVVQNDILSSFWVSPL